MAILIPPPPRATQEFDHFWKDWLYNMWLRVKSLEPGESGGGDSNALHKAEDGEVFGMTGKGIPVGADLLMIEDSADGYSKAKLTFTNLWRMEDSVSWYYGTGNDASIVYDGTNLVINPKVVGTGILDVTGTVGSDGRIEAINTTAKTANYSISVTDENILCDTSGGAFTVTLPASPESGRVYTIILETAGNTLTISGNGKNILGASTGTLSKAGDAVQLVYNGTQWSLK
jgi:hypothetical protein